jgi:hypothetical protein
LENASGSGSGSGSADADADADADSDACPVLNTHTYSPAILLQHKQLCTRGRGNSKYALQKIPTNKKKRCGKSFGCTS